MELYWGLQDCLSFRVDLKPNQQLKYLNSDSTHTKACFKAIPAGVSTRLAKLTTLIESNANASLQHLYPLHFQKLAFARLVSQFEVPTLSQELLKYQAYTIAQASQEQQTPEDERQGKDPLLLY
jgi:hypothetical protein